MSNRNDISQNQLEKSVSAVKMLDPVDGKEIELNFQWMRLHPCEIIANDTNNTYDETAVKASHAFLEYQSSTKCSDFLRANETRIDATDLFDPELLSPLEEESSASQEKETSVKKN
mmetsp:Transcript_26752/g.39574  ORF Transcript_26752/g.39574 Transcript_26752/m.39574 type:complete len:116 (-) Transcript_26752:927-1274(-)